MTIHAAVRAPVQAAAGSTRWRTHLVLLGTLSAAILLLHWRDAVDMAAIWWTSSTYNHCVLILPIIVWLVRQRLPALRQIKPAGWWPGLFLVASGALLSLLGEAGGINLLRHAGLVAMLQGAAIGCLGVSVSRALAFPIFYAVFLVPAGEELVPALQTVTAYMCMALLAVVGIPAHLQGIFITTPDGYFEVAEACSGVKFLVAMVAYGALVANVCFRSWRRRAAFMAAAILIPILANGVRAWGTIYIASATNSDFASGFDHVVYGWVFFAVVIALLMAVGWQFFDRKPGDLPDPVRDTKAGSGRVLPVVLAAASLAALPPIWSAVIASTAAQSVPSDLNLPDVSGWTRVPDTSGRPWRPYFAGADLFRIGRYRNGQGRVVDLAIAVYARQSEGRELVGFGQGAVGPESGWAWIGSGPAPEGGKLDRIASHGTVREVATFYRVGSVLTGRDVEVKLETARTRLLGGPQRAVAVLVSAEAPGEGESARPALDAFLLALGQVAPLADRAAGLPGTG